jgi:hypothetical protein
MHTVPGDTRVSGLARLKRASAGDVKAHVGGAAGAALLAPPPPLLPPLLPLAAATAAGKRAMEHVSGALGGVRLRSDARLTPR